MVEVFVILGWLVVAFIGWASISQATIVVGMVISAGFLIMAARRMSTR